MELFRNCTWKVPMRRYWWYQACYCDIKLKKRININQILTPKAMYNFCKQHFNEITFFTFLQRKSARYAQAKRIPVARSYHRFRPIGSSILEIMRTSEQEDYLIKFHLNNVNDKVVSSDLIGSYAACTFDSIWWIRVAEEASEDEADIEIKLMQFNPGTKTFRLPTKEDKCWIPCSNMLTVIKKPSHISANSRHYTITNEELM